MNGNGSNDAYVSPVSPYYMVIGSLEMFICSCFFVFVNFSAISPFLFVILKNYLQLELSATFPMHVA